MREPPTVATTPSLEAAGFEVAAAGFDLDVLVVFAVLLLVLEAGFGAVLLPGACALTLSAHVITKATTIHEAPVVLFTACTSLVFSGRGS
jgi:hypothetical protein